MSKKRLCVCGRKRGKEPLIITITTCRHNHSLKIEDCFNISPPLATSSTIDVTSTAEPSGQRPGDQKNKSLAETKQKVTKQTGDTLYVTGKDQSGSINKSNEDSTLNTYCTADGTIAGQTTTGFSNYTAALSSQGQDSTYESAINDSTINDTTRNNTSTGYSADESTRFSNSSQSELTGFETANDTSINSSKNKSKNPTIMFLTETAINTMPFLDNLFWTKSTSSKSMPSLSEERFDQEDCSLEVFVFEKHSKLCKHLLKYEGSPKENAFFDGDTLFETLGKVSFPVDCEDFRATKSQKLASIYSQLKENFTNDHNPLDTFNRLVKDKQFFQNLNTRSEPLNIKLNKYITLGDDIYKKNNNSLSATDIEELYFRKKTKDRSVQVGFDASLSNNTKSKWYNIFLLCLGIKDSEDDYKNELQTKSSLLITKYLRL